FLVAALRVVAIGAAVGGVTDVGIQGYRNWSFLKVNWSEVAESAALGGLLSGLGPEGGLFGRGGFGFARGLLNIPNNYLRVGWGWRGEELTGQFVFRIAGSWVERRWGQEHLDLWRLGPAVLSWIRPSELGRLFAILGGLGGAGLVAAYNTIGGLSTGFIK